MHTQRYTSEVAFLQLYPKGNEYKQKKVFEKRGSVCQSGAMEGGLSFGEK
jgi:hypothetical protein